jgi:hypothetical protein
MGERKKEDLTLLVKKLLLLCAVCFIIFGCALGEYVCDGCLRGRCWLRERKREISLCGRKSCCSVLCVF